MQDADADASASGLPASVLWRLPYTFTLISPGPHFPHPVQDADADALASGLPASVLWRLRCWAEELLRGGYNALMQAARK